MDVGSRDDGGGKASSTLGVSAVAAVNVAAVPVVAAGQPAILMWPRGSGVAGHQRRSPVIQWPARGGGCVGGSRLHSRESLHTHPLAQNFPDRRAQDVGHMAHSETDTNPMPIPASNHLWSHVSRQ